MNRFILACGALALLVLPACDSVLDTEPIASLTPEVVFSNGENLNAALVATYNALQGFYDDYTIMPELAADNAIHTGSFPSWQEVDGITNIPANNAEVLGQWSGSYSLINLANSVIVLGADTPTNIDFSETEKAQVIAQAKVLRAFAYHNLVRWFGDVPLILQPTTPASEGATLFVGRTAASAVYDQIVKDLTEAEATLPASGPSAFVSSTTAKALLSRVYLYTENYAGAAAKAQEVISSGSFSGADPVWNLTYSVNDQNGMAFFAYRAGRYEYAPDPDIASAYASADSTRRKRNIAFVGPDLTIVKYTDLATGSDPLFPIRYAEVVLNRAEALARTSNESGARDLLNQIRPDDLGDIAATVTGTGLIDAIIAERRLELAFEGHRWHDLIRTGRAQSELGFTDTKALLWPIPQRELDINSNLTQNPGY